MPHNVALNIFLTISLKNIYTPDKKKLFLTYITFN